MDETHTNKFNTLTHISITVAIVVTVMLFFLPACSGGGKNGKVNLPNPDSIPDLVTTDVNTLISDSGVLRYKMITPEWVVYMRGLSPRWIFEKGIYLEKFDSLFRVDASIKADTAYYYQDQKLWELRGNVHIKNQEGVMFDTQLLFWNQNTERFYSDKRVNIAKHDTIFSGEKFESNQQMTEYVFYNGAGNMIVKDIQPVDTTQTKK
ncbi:MAG: LPS export ABC transporter periplasmic protein LptC [Phocaeicola sp.]|nr:LPS export ABC transporter periplasmic protein LptC [Phocaeicola sp.]